MIVEICLKPEQDLVSPPFSLYVDGEEIENELATADFSRQVGRSGFTEVRLFDSTLINRIQGVALHDFAANDAELIINISLESKCHDLPFGAYVVATITRELNVFDRHEYSLCVIVNPDYTEWKQPWSARDFFEEAKALISGVKISALGLAHFTESFNMVLQFSHPSPDPASSLESVIEYSARTVQHDLQLIATSLNEKSLSNSIVKSFNFPEEVKVSCEQYLLYFVQFLKDLGVEANAEIKHEADRVLFSVTPASGPDALNKIRDALDIYLRLPSHAEANLLIPGAEIEVQRLSANIMHLNGQIALAQAMVQFKDATIEMKEETIRQLRGELLIQPEPYIDQAKREEDTEDVLGGIVSIKPFDVGFANINLPTIYRKLKSLMSEEESSS